MRKINIWIDCDPGIDDAVALAAAAASRDKLNICGISTVAGNQSAEKVIDNALRLSSLLGMDDVPVVCGSDEPLIRKSENAGHVHGENGLGNCRLPETGKKPVSKESFIYMYNKIMELPPDEKINVLPIGPLTNIALLLRAFPEIKTKIDRIILMGGSSSGGNTTPYAEFNIYSDPEAAHMVFASGLPIVMCGLDVTQKCGLTRKQISGLISDSCYIKRIYGEMLSNYFDSPVHSGLETVCIHDAVTVLYLIAPHLFKGSYVNVEVDCSDSITRGATACGKIALGSKDGKNIFMLESADVKGFGDLLMSLLDSFGSRR